MTDQDFVRTIVLMVMAAIMAVGIALLSIELFLLPSDPASAFYPHTVPTTSTAVPHHSTTLADGSHNQP